jgi:hypothetical protein
LPPANEGEFQVQYFYLHLLALPFGMVAVWPTKELPLTGMPSGRPIMVLIAVQLSRAPSARSRSTS